MEIDMNKNQILKVLLKDFNTRNTVTSLSESLNMTRAGVWKILKKLESEKLVVLSPLGTGRTSTCTVSLYWDNPLVEKILAVLLVEEALKNQRWIANFSELEPKVDFLIIYGSIITSPKAANDIDIVSIVPFKSGFVEIDNIISKIQKTQIKKIHALHFTKDEFREELTKPNKVFLDALNKGAVLFGHERFVKFMEEEIYHGK